MTTTQPHGLSEVRVGSIGEFSDDVVSLATGTPWQVPWELLMLGPFGSCVLHDNGAISSCHGTGDGAKCDASFVETGRSAVPVRLRNPSLVLTRSRFDRCRSVSDGKWLERRCRAGQGTSDDHGRRSVSRVGTFRGPSGAGHVRPDSTAAAVLIVPAREKTRWARSRSKRFSNASDPRLNG